MTDAMSRREIEDVLVSIRRLVSQEDKAPAVRSSGAPTERPAEKLVLTSALRVDEPAKGFDPHPFVPSAHEAGQDAPPVSIEAHAQHVGAEDAHRIAMEHVPVAGAPATTESADATGDQARAEDLSAVSPVWPDMDAQEPLAPRPEQGGDAALAPQNDAETVAENTTAPETASFASEGPTADAVAQADSGPSAPKVTPTPDAEDEPELPADEELSLFANVTPVAAPAMAPVSGVARPVGRDTDRPGSGRELWHSPAGSLLSRIQNASNLRLPEGEAPPLSAGAKAQPAPEGESSPAPAMSADEPPPLVAFRRARTGQPPVSSEEESAVAQPEPGAPEGAARVTQPAEPETQGVEDSSLEATLARLEALLAGGASEAVTPDEPVGEDAPAADEAAREPVIDETMLYQLVAHTVRQELQGELGEKITRNIRKLVRAEVARELALRKL